MRWLRAPDASTRNHDRSAGTVTAGKKDKILSHKDKPATLPIGALDNLMVKHQSAVDEQIQRKLVVIKDWLMARYGMSEEESHKFCMHHKSILLPILSNDPSSLESIVNDILARTSQRIFGEQHLCRVSGYVVVLSWAEKGGKIVDPDCTARECHRRMKPGHIPQNLNDQPYGPCPLRIDLIKANSQ